MCIYRAKHDADGKVRIGKLMRAQECWIAGWKERYRLKGPSFPNLFSSRK